MKLRSRIATTQTPDGGEMALYQHDSYFSIEINGQTLMNSREHESELALARLGCAHLVGRKAPRVLIGGLGLGYTLRQTLDMLNPHAQIVVGELLGFVVKWNREFLRNLNGQPLEDKRVDLKTGDIVEFIMRSKSRFDAILLDIDNGPSAIVDTGNHRLYGREGILACRRLLGAQGCLSVWSVEPSKKFEKLLRSCSFHARCFRVPNYKMSKSRSRFVWVASEDKINLPSGCKGELYLP
jgi:spermidine synthase